MDVIYTKELMVPMYQVGLLLALSTLTFMFGKAKLSLLINYAFLLYWVYWLNQEALIGKGAPSITLFNLCYFGFGLVIVALALIGFLNRPD